MLREIWKSIPGYEGLYEISSFGDVRTLEREWTSGRGLVRKVKPGLKSQTFDKDGYPRVTLCKNGKKNRIRVAVLVATAFIGPYPTPTIQIRHLDHSRTNSRLDNLKYGTIKENAEDRQANPAFVHPRGMLGKKHTPITRQQMSESHKRRKSLEVR